MNKEILDMLVYGAGNMASQVVAQYQLKGIRIKSIVVSDTAVNPKALLGVPVKSITEFISIREKVCIIIGVSEIYCSEVIELLDKMGFYNRVFPELFPMQYTFFTDSSKEEFLAKWYFLMTKKELDWTKLCTYNEKMQWLKLYDRDERKTLYTDKYRVREYVARKIGQKYLIPLLGVWDKFDDIDFEKLPSSFVLKCNHGSGWNQIVKNKECMSMPETKKKFDLWMDTNYGDLYGLELQYENIERKIIAEELLSIDGETDILDYKFFAFDGKVELIQVDIDRSLNHRRNLYTPDWTLLPYEILFPSAPEVTIPKPAYLDEMIHIAEGLAKGFIHVRVDLYLVNEKIYFGELTFTHGSGVEEFRPESLGEKLGKLMNITT